MISWLLCSFQPSLGQPPTCLVSNKHCHLGPFTMAPSSQLHLSAQTDGSSASHCSLQISLHLQTHFGDGVLCTYQSYAMVFIYLCLTGLPVPSVGLCTWQQRELKPVSLAPVSPPTSPGPGEDSGVKIKSGGNSIGEQGTRSICTVTCSLVGIHIY